MRAVRAGGRMSMIGVLAGASVDVNLALVVMANVRLQGVTVGSRDMLADMCRAMAQHGTRVPIDSHVYAFDELRPALESMPSGHHFGKIALRF